MNSYIYPSRFTIIVLILTAALVGSARAQTEVVLVPLTQQWRHFTNLYEPPGNWMTGIDPAHTLSLSAQTDRPR